MNPISSTASRASPDLSAASANNTVAIDAVELGPTQGASKKCHCKKSRCLKLYCECFAANVLCKGCSCLECENTDGNERRKAMQHKLSRNRTAFEPKFKPTALFVPSGQSEFLHIRGCNCKRSNCRKKYCECFQAGIACSTSCKCIQCQNDGSLPHLRNFGVHDWVMPSCRQATGSVIGQESLMMIVPVAGQNQEQNQNVEADKPRRAAIKHQRAQSYDATMTRPVAAAKIQQSPVWDNNAMNCIYVSPPIKTTFNTMQADTEMEEPPPQRRKCEQKPTQLEFTPVHLDLQNTMSANDFASLLSSCEANDDKSETKSCSQIASEFISQGINETINETSLGDEMWPTDDMMDLFADVDDAHYVKREPIESITSPCRAQQGPWNDQEKLDILDHRVVWGC